MHQDDILEQIRRRPAMYTGENTLRSIYLFFHGYDFAIHRHAISAEDDPLILPIEFHSWVAYRLHFYEPTSGWYNMICERTSSDQEAIDRFFELLKEFKTRTPHTVAKLEGFKKTYRQSTALRDDQGELIWEPTEIRNFPKSISLVTYTSDPGFFAFSDTSDSFPAQGFHPDLESFELQLDIDRSMLTIFDKNWHPKPYSDE